MQPSDLPTQSQLEEVLLEMFHTSGISAHLDNIYHNVTNRYPMTMDLVRYPHSDRLVLRDRIRWGLSRLKREGLMSNPERCWWQRL